MVNKVKLKELQKQEAIKRLEILQEVYNLHPNILKEFKNDDTRYTDINVKDNIVNVSYISNGRCAADSIEDTISYEITGSSIVQK